MSKIELIIYPPIPSSRCISNLRKRLHDSPSCSSPRPDISLILLLSPSLPCYPVGSKKLVNLVSSLYFSPSTLPLLQSRPLSVSLRILQWPPKWYFYLQSLFQLTVYTTVIAQSKFDHVGLLTALNSLLLSLP